MTTPRDIVRALGGWWFWIPASVGLLVWGTFAAVWWHAGPLMALLVTFGGIGLVVVGAFLSLLALFLFDGHEPFCAYAGCGKRAPLQIRGKPYRQPFCPEHALAALRIPPPRGMETLTVDDLPRVVDASGTSSGPR